MSDISYELIVEVLRAIGNNYAYVASAMAVSVVGVVAYFAKKASDISGFAYAVTRTRVMRSRMLRKAKLKELAESYSISDVIAAFEGSAYEQYVAGKGSIEEIEQALLRNLADDYNKVLAMSPRKAKPLFELMSARYDVENIKRIVAAKVTKSQVQELLPSKLSPAFLQRLQDAETLEEMLELLKASPYAEVFKELHAVTPEAIELALDRYFYGKLLSIKNIESVAKKAGLMNDSLYLKEIFGLQIDILNIKIALRCVINNIEDQKAKELLIEKGYYTNSKLLGRAIESAELQAVINALQGTPYYDIMSNALREYEKEKSAYVFEKALLEYYAQRVESLALKQPFGLTPLVCYLLLKELEIKNLTTILNCIKEGLPKEKIKELFVGG